MKSDIPVCQYDECKVFFHGQEYCMNFDSKDYRDLIYVNVQEADSHMYNTALCDDMNFYCDAGNHIFSSKKKEDLTALV